jgi:predicted nucleic acid-binding protein
LNLEIILLPSREGVALLRGVADDKDAPVLASTVNGRADFFLSGDQNLLSSIREKGGVSFMAVTPADFLNKIISGILSLPR